MSSSIMGAPLKTIDLRNFGVPLKKAIQMDKKLERFANNNGRIDLGDPHALREYNRFIFSELAGIEVFIPEGFLIPTAGLRIKAVEIIKEVILNSKKPFKKGIEIGTGATAINTMLLAKNNFNMIATEIDEDSFYWAQKNIAKNNLFEKITLLKSKGELIKGIIDFSSADTLFDFVLTFPPYYETKDTHLVFKDRGFQGREKELIGGRGGIEFSINILSEAKEIGIIKYCFIMLDKKFRAEKVFSKGIDLGWEMNWIKFVAGTRTRFFVFGRNPDF